jgi:2-methylcitrate dehydratase PrpD
MGAEAKGKDLKKEDIERRLADYIVDTKYDEIPKDIIELAKILTFTLLGTTIAGAQSEGCQAVLDLLKGWGGKGESTILIHGGKIPAHDAALVNSYMARALDFCDGMVPGMHLGSSCIPASLAAVELAGGCSGKEFLTSLIAGAEVASRINACSNYDGFDPTGVCAIFAVAGTTARILKLDREGMLNTLAIAFNRSGGSFQSNIDGALTVRGIQGFTSRDGILSAELAKVGITGPQNFLKGQYGYFHLYGEDKYDVDTLLGAWMERFYLKREVFKKFPSCWATQSGTEAMLQIIKETGVTAENVDHIAITMTPGPYKLVGHKFEMGDRPTVNAQFNVSYCAANALLRRSSRIEHFDPPAIKDPKVLAVLEKIDVTVNPDLEQTGHNAVIMRVNTRNGQSIEKVLPYPFGGPDHPLSKEEHIARFHDCFQYGGGILPKERADRILSAVDRLEELEDVRELVSLLLP